MLGSLVEGSVNLVLLDLHHSVTVDPRLHFEIPDKAEITIDVDEFHWYASLRLRVDPSVTHKKRESNEALSFR